MSLFDSIKSSLSGSLGQAAAAALPQIIETVLPGGLQGLLDRLQQSGHAAQVNSWLGRGSNEPITTGDLRRVIGDDHVRMIAEKLGLPPDQVLATLSKLLPEAVDRQSPNGTLQSPPPRDA